MSGDQNGRPTLSVLSRWIASNDAIGRTQIDRLPCGSTPTKAIFRPSRSRPPSDTSLVERTKTYRSGHPRGGSKRHRARRRRRS